MNDYKVTDAELISVADAIRTKGGTSASLPWPDGFVSAISDISSGGIIPSGSLSISANGTYDVTSFANAVVDVPTGGGSNDNFKIAVRAISGSIYDNEISTIGDIAFYRNSMITDANMLSVLGIGSSAFNGCSNLSTVSFPECTSIGSYAFSGCSNLSTVSLPKCTSIGASAFNGCSNLSTVSLPECTSIGSYAFSGCSNLSTVSLPKCTSIGSYTFSGCSNLSTVSLPECTSIWDRAFQGCSNLSTVSLPKCTSIGAYAFQGCKSLTTVSFPACTTIGTSAFRSGNIESIFLPTCEYIGSDAFYQCSTLKNIYAPLVETLSGSAIFYGTKLDSVSFPRLSSTFDAITYGVFANNPSLSTAYFEDLSYIGGKTFCDCAKLMSVYLLSNAVATLMNVTAFQSTPIAKSSGGVYGSIYVPASLVDAYKSATNWSTYSDRITAYTE